MNNILDETELSPIEREFIHNAFSYNNLLKVRSVYKKPTINRLFIVLLFIIVCIAGIIKL